MLIVKIRNLPFNKYTFVTAFLMHQTCYFLSCFTFYSTAAEKKNSVQNINEKFRATIGNSSSDYL